jgi:hypothetical protein
MDWFGISGWIIGIIGLIIGVIQLYEMYKKKRYPGKIVLAKQGIFSLFDSIVKNFPTIAIQYKNTPIEDTLIYFKASLVNIGDIDIKEAMIDLPITLELPEGLIWAEAKSTKKSENLTCKIDIQNGKKLIFNISLFKIDEFIEFDALIQLADISQRYEIDNMKISHRIADTQEIEKTNISILESKKNVWYDVILIGIFLIFNTFALFNTSSSVGVIYYQNPKGVLYDVSIINQDSVKLRNIKNQEYKIIPIEILQNEKQFKIISDKESNRGFITILILFIINLLSLSFLLIIKYILFMIRQKKNRLYKILESN